MEQLVGILFACFHTTGEEQHWPAMIAGSVELTFTGFVSRRPTSSTKRSLLFTASM
jgi:hypothetical protein